MNYKTRIFFHFILLPLALSACTSRGLFTTVGPDYQSVLLSAPTNWQSDQSDTVNATAPILAHEGNQTELLHWWEGFQDPVLTRLLTAAEQVNASLSDAKARIAEARANIVSADSAIMPTLDFTGGARRSSSSFGGSPFIWTQYSVGLQSSWELDLFGGLARQHEAAHSQLESRNAAWHDARVAVAIEVADAYLGYRFCEARKQLLQTDSNSRQESSRLSNITRAQGFSSVSETALANASAADSKKAVLQQIAQCERHLKGIVSLTGIQESDLRTLLNQHAEQIAKLPTPPEFKIAAIPAKVLLQRPDISGAERDVAEACANIGVERAKQFPKLSLSGNITPTLQNMNGAALMLAQTWAIGPTLSLPLFDAGKRAADVETAKAKYQAASSRFNSKVRIAVKEVEEALVRLDSAHKSLPEALSAENGYKTNFNAMQTLYTNGLGNLLDVETARRNMLSAELATKDLKREQVSAWIALYRAAGGNWSNDKQLH